MLSGLCLSLPPPSTGLREVEPGGETTQLGSVGVVLPGEIHMPVCMCVYVYMYVFVHVGDGIYSHFAHMCLGGCLMC